MGTHPQASIEAGNYSGEEEKFEDEATTHSQSSRYSRHRRGTDDILLEATLVTEKLKDIEMSTNEVVQAEPLQDPEEMFPRALCVSWRSLCCIIVVIVAIACVGVAVGTELGRRRYSNTAALGETASTPTRAPIFVVEDEEGLEGQSMDHIHNITESVLTSTPEKESAEAESDIDSMEAGSVTQSPSSSNSSVNVSSIDTSSIPEFYFSINSLPEKTRNSLNDPTTHQSLAYEWLVGDPNLSKRKNLVQRFALASLFFATRGDNWTKKTNWLATDEGVHECDWLSDAPRGLVCHSNQYKILSLNLNELNGTLPDEMWLLSTLVSITFYKQNLQGTRLPTWLGKMPMLENLALYDLGLEGYLPNEIAFLTQ
jgi:hypothetical protein